MSRTNLSRDPSVFLIIDNFENSTNVRIPRAKEKNSASGDMEHCR
jgi:hypothetical protein